MAGRGAYEVIGRQTTSRRRAGGKSGEQRPAKTLLSVGIRYSRDDLGHGARSQRGHGRHEVVQVRDGCYGFQSLFVLDEEIGNNAGAAL
jgi:hypothetical protein